MNRREPHLVLSFQIHACLSHALTLLSLDGFELQISALRSFRFIRSTLYLTRKNKPFPELASKNRKKRSLAVIKKAICKPVTKLTLSRTQCFPKMRVLDVLSFVLCTTGIYISYLTQGIVQESLSTEGFGPENQRFANMAILSCVQGLGCLVVSFVLLKLLPKAQNKRDYAPLKAFWSVGVTTTLGPSLGYASLRNINYAAQV